MKDNLFAQARRESIVKYLYQCSQIKIFPSIREIAAETGIPSTSVVNFYMERLQRDGWVSKTPKISRGLFLTKAGERLAMALLKIDMSTCPHCGAPVNPDGKFEEKKKTEKTAVKYKPQRVSVSA